MRRVASVIMFVIGGWMLLSELMIAFLDFEPGMGDNAIMVGIIAVLAGVPLLLGAGISPGARWRELGLTMLISAACGLLYGVSIVAVLSDQGLKPFMPPMPEIQFVPFVGVANLLVIAGLGWLLYRRPVRSEPDLEKVFGE